MAEAVKTPVERAREAKAEAAKNGKGKEAADKPLESKSARFIRLANMRVPKALKVIGHVANLSLRAQYEYTPEQAAKIIQLLQTELDTLKRRFAEPAKGAVPTSIF